MLTSAELLRSAFNDVFNYFSSLMQLQTHLKEGAALIKYDVESGETGLDFTDLYEHINQSIATNQANGANKIVDFASALKFVGLSSDGFHVSGGDLRRNWKS